jgi:hypothetical protein
LMLDVTNEAGEIEHWTVETTAPVYCADSAGPRIRSNLATT